MRKVTGYIGALIVVVALMGSILAGYALNINGQSTVVNEYENVTDVSGLYSHTDQKTYIDYNPASNYIGYSSEKAYENAVPSNGYTLKEINSGTIVIEPSTQTITINGVSRTGFPSTYLQTAFFCNKAFFEGGGTSIHYVAVDGVTVNVSAPITITINNNTTTITFNQETHVLTDVTHNLVYYTGADWDYIERVGIRGGDSTALNVYIDNINDVLSAGSDGREYSSCGGTKYYRSSTDTATMDFTKSGTHIDGNVYQMNINYSISGSMPYGVYYPRYAYTPGVGIDYTESNRVNNYIIGYREIGGTPVTTSSRIDLQNVSTTNYATPNKSWIMDEGWTDFDEHYNPIWDWQLKAPSTYTVYKFTDLLTSLSVPANTINVTLKIPMIMAGDYYASPLLRTIWDWPDGSDLTMVSNMPYNLVMIGNNAGTYDYKVSDSQYGINGTISNNNLFRTASYDVSTGLVNIYDYNGTKVLTDSVNNIYIQYLKNPGVSGYVDSINRNTAAHVTDTYTINYRTNTPSYQTISPVSMMDVDITTSTSTSTPIYMDITKGIKIDPANVLDTIWNNEYENGTVKLLFRASDTYGTYHNEFSVSDNTISVDYTGSRFFITLNGAEQIDVGAWRSIILNIDMLNGEVFINPVRTFNSYTNISADKAMILIGDTINNTPITSISWKPTPNSFTFGVYATDVFLNTYGVVMVNPSLTITNYFTDLNNFYRLVLNNFSTYGDSITVNGVTGNVSGNAVTFNDETITLKNLEIIYADGHVYVEDDNDSVDLGTIVNNDISLSGVWYFETDLDRGYTAMKQIYTWDWTDFILNNTQFCIFYIGMALIGLVVARRFCIMTVIDYAVFITSIIIALSTQVIA